MKLYQVVEDHEGRLLVRELEVKSSTARHHRCAVLDPKGREAREVKLERSAAGLGLSREGAVDAHLSAMRKSVDQLRGRLAAAERRLADEAAMLSATT